MAENIFVALIVVVVIGAGVFCWWLENGSNRKHKEEDTKKDNIVAFRPRETFKGDAS